MQTYKECTLRAKKEKRPFADVVNTYLDAQKITSKEKEEILNTMA
jgi:hypothetical protein